MVLILSAFNQSQRFASLVYFVFEFVRVFISIQHASVIGKQIRVEHTAWFVNIINVYDE